MTFADLAPIDKVNYHDILKQLYDAKNHGRGLIDYNSKGPYGPLSESLRALMTEEGFYFHAQPAYTIQIGLNGKVGDNDPKHLSGVEGNQYNDIKNKVATAQRVDVTETLWSNVRNILEKEGYMFEKVTVLRVSKPK